jgi:5-methylcytosine-specific restriction endonuclease McrA
MTISLPPTVIHSLLLYVVGMIILTALAELLKSVIWEKKRKQRKKYYNEEYLQSDDWQRKRFVVLKRDNWKCVYCGARATEVHHKKYARKNIGREPIDWLVSVCAICHEKQHS